MECMNLNFSNIMHMCSYDMGVEESKLNPSNMMHASTHGRFGNALGIESLVNNRFEGPSAEFLLAMAELCSLPSETPPHYTSRHDIYRF